MFTFDEIKTYLRNIGKKAVWAKHSTGFKSLMLYDEEKATLTELYFTNEGKFVSSSSVHCGAESAKKITFNVITNSSCSFSV